MTENRHISLLVEILFIFFLSLCRLQFYTTPARNTTAQNQTRHNIKPEGEVSGEGLRVTLVTGKSGTGRLQFYTTPARNTTAQSQTRHNIKPEEEVSGEGLRVTLVTGKSGTGKSTLINGLLGRKVDNLKFTSNSFSIRDVKVEVAYWDCPGIYDGSLPKEKYVAMREVMKETDLILHTIKMDDTRVRPEDIKCVQQLTALYGKDLWRKAVFVLTFANRVTYLNEHQEMIRSRDHIHRKTDEWKKHFHSILRGEGVSEEIVRGVPFFPAGHYSRTNIFDDDDKDGGVDDWINELRDCVIQRTGRTAWWDI